MKYRVRHKKSGEIAHKDHGFFLLSPDGSLSIYGTGGFEVARDYVVEVYNDDGPICNQKTYTEKKSETTFTTDAGTFKLANY